MKRKGWDAIEEESIPSFLQVHNSVNERSWRMLCEWERKFGGLTASGTDDIKLVRFEGRPTDMTPKALLLSTLGLKPKPFDRHDWYIDNGTDHEKRYVLDFYMSGYEDGGSDIPRVDIDVRPALDTPHAVVQRGQRIFQELFPGISKELGLLYSKTNSGRGD
jgi:cytochrome c heme-lyase